MSGVRRTAVLILIFATAGCTYVSVRPVTPASSDSGIRYSLPKPALQVVPNIDGSVTVDVVFLPDPEHTYAIDSFTALSAHSLDVTISRGLLQKIGSVTDATAVAADVIRAAGTVATDFLKQEATAAQTKATNVATAQSSLDTAETNLAAAVAKRDAMIGRSKPEEMATQEIMIAELTAKRDRAQVILDREKKRDLAPTPSVGTFKASSTGANMTLDKLTPAATQGGSAAVVSGTTIRGGGKPKVWGPALFTVDEGVVVEGDASRPTVILRSVEIRRPQPGQAGAGTARLQHEFETIMLRTVTRPAPDKDGLINVLLDAKGAGSFELKTEYPIAKLLPPHTLSPKSPVEPAVTREAGGKTIRIDVSQMPPGIYQLTMRYEYKRPDGTSGKHEWGVDFRVQK